MDTANTENTRALKSRYNAFAWGVMITLLGIFSLTPGDQQNLFWIGTGVTLFMTNIVAHYIHKFPINWFWTLTGVTVFLIGLASQLNLHITIPIFEIALILIGVSLIIRTVTFKKE